MTHRGDIFVQGNIRPRPHDNSVVYRAYRNYRPNATRTESFSKLWSPHTVERLGSIQVRRYRITSTPYGRTLLEQQCSLGVY